MIVFNFIFTKSPLDATIRKRECKGHVLLQFHYIFVPFSTVVKNKFLPALGYKLFAAV